MAAIKREFLVSFGEDNQNEEETIQIDLGDLDLSEEDQKTEVVGESEVSNLSEEEETIVPFSLKLKT